jgi:membrane-bound lytic murein transglycosylase B
LNLLSATPPAIVHQLRAEEAALVTASGARFVRVARGRQLQIRALGRNRARAKAVERLRYEERDDLEARLDIEAISAANAPPVGGVKVGPAAPATTLLSWYREAQHRFGIRWQLLAAINFVESDFGRARTTAKADAQGPMQFEPATWRRYGMGGDVYDPHDAILAAANLLAANHGRTDERRALAHYNPSPLYWDAVLHYAHRIQTVRFAFREYYAWKLYVRKAAAP